MAVPELISCKASSRLRRFKHKTQHFSTDRPADNGSSRAHTFPGASSFSPGSCARSRMRRASSIAAASSAAFAGPNPCTLPKSCVSQVANAAKLPASVKSFVATTGLGDPFVPVPMSNSMSSVSKRALGPKRTKRSRGRSSSVIPSSTSLLMIAQRRVRLSQTP